MARDLAIRNYLNSFSGVELMVGWSLTGSCFLRLLLERGEGKGKERKRDTSISCISPTGYLACNVGMCPDWELNW